jgi:hypothetical protein
VLVLKTLISQANAKKVVGKFTWDQFNRFMTNVGDEEFNYESFKLAFDSNPGVTALVKRFDQDGIELKTNEQDVDTATQTGAPSAVEKMAKRATQSAQNT